MSPPGWQPEDEEEELDGFDIEEFERAASQQRDARGRAGRARSEAAVAPRLEDEARDDIVAVPPGYRIVSEEERLETLAQLQAKLRELDEIYARLPLKIETTGQRQQQQYLRGKIAETERAVKLFSWPQVLMSL